MCDNLCWIMDNVIACVMKREEKKVKFTTDLLTNKILIPPLKKKKEEMEPLFLENNKGH